MAWWSGSTDTPGVASQPEDVPGDQLPGADSLEAILQRLQKLEVSVAQLQQNASSNDSGMRQTSVDGGDNSLVDTAERLKSDVQQVVDAIRKDVGAQRRLLDDFHLRMETLKDTRQHQDRLPSGETIKDAVISIKDSFSWSALRKEFVSLGRFTEVYTDLKLEIKGGHLANGGKIGHVEGLGNVESLKQELAKEFLTVKAFHEWHKGFQDQVKDLRLASKGDTEVMRGMMDYSALKAGYLAVAASECSPQEKAMLFETLKHKEGEIAGLKATGVQFPQGRPNYDNAVTSLVDVPVPPRIPAGVEYNATISKNGKKAGMNLAEGGDRRSLLVEKVCEGFVNDWNMVNPSQAVQAGDHIVGVNGVRGSSDVLVQETRNESSNTLVLTVKRTGSTNAPAALDGVNEERVPLIMTQGEKLGLSLDCHDGKTLIIQEVKQGAIQKWNDAHPTTAIKAGDKIVSANGTRGYANEILTEATKGGEVTLGIIRGYPSKQYL